VTRVRGDHRRCRRLRAVQPHSSNAATVASVRRCRRAELGHLLTGAVPWQTERQPRIFGVTREHPFVNPAGRSLSVTVTVQLMTLGESWPGFGIDGLAPVRTWCFRPGRAEVPVTGRGAGSLCAMPDCGDLGRCSGNHLREPPCRLSQASRGISGHGFRRSSA
jgi:hypothetical protein